MLGNMDDLNKRIFTLNESTENDRNQQQQLSEEQFRQIYFYEPPLEQSIADKIRNVKCSCGFFTKVFPILQWLPMYKKRDLISDLIAGLTVAVMHIPQGMAYALLGGVPPVVGIYMAFFPVLIYILMGTSRHVSMGTFAVVCMMVGKSVDTYSHFPGSNSTEVVQQTHLEVTYTPIEVATAVCLVVGFWQLVLSILRLGSLSVLLSRTLVSGFTTGAAVHVLTSQIRNLLGIKVKRYSGPLKIIYSYADIFLNISNLNVLATVLSVSFIVFLVVFNDIIKPYIQKKFKKTISLPVELLVVIIGTLLSQNLKMKENFGVAVVDYVPTGLPKPSVPPLDLIPKLLMDGLVIAIVAISINISMATIFAQKLGYEIDGNQEILASGIGNIFSAFFSCMPFAASLSRSLIQESVGGKTQITSIVSSLTLVFVLLFIAHFFEPLPYCVLSTIIVVALKGMFKQINELPEIYKNSKADGLVWIVTFISVVALDIDIGLGIGLLASIASILQRSLSPKVVSLGRVPNTSIYLDVSRYKKAQTLPRILILKVIGGLHFANSSSVKKKIEKSFSKFSKDLPVDFVNVEKQSKCLTLVIDLSCVPFVDPSAIKSLRMVYNDLKLLQSNLLICGCVPSVYESLVKSEYFDNFPRYLVFHNLQDAVEYAIKLENRRSSDNRIEFISKF